MLTDVASEKLSGEMQQRDVIIFVVLITTNLALEPMLILLCVSV